jgi:membrane dipeptidase
MLMIDSHLDLGWNALQWNRNLLQSVYTLRAQEKGIDEKGRAQGTVAFPEMRHGRMALCFATVLARNTGVTAPHIDFGSQAQAYAIAQGHLLYYRALEREGHIRIITGLAALDKHVAEWQAWDSAHPAAGSTTSAQYAEQAAKTAGQVGPAQDTPPLGFVVSMESADAIRDPEQLSEWHAAGLRIIGPAHYGPGRFAGGTSTELGLTSLGVGLLAEMDRLGVILDLTHLCDESFWHALEVFHGPVLASHNNCRALVPHQRQFSDEQLRAIIARDGVIGSAFDTWMLIPDWNKGTDTNRKAGIATVVDHIEHVCQLAGNSAHAAIGSDLDGGYGREQSPHDLDTIADMQQIAVILAQRGYQETDIAAIMHGNWLRLLRRAWSQQLEPHGRPIVVDGNQ